MKKHRTGRVSLPIAKLAQAATLALATTLTLTACSKGGGNTLTDARDGKTYKTVKIGEQVWMAENLNFDSPSSKCYDNYPSNCQKYGRLYNWETAMRACPDGWHLPSKAEWEILITSSGGRETAGKSLKATSDWPDDYEGKSGNGTDNYGFSALPSGTGSYAGNFYSINRHGYWWSSSEGNANEYSLNNAYIRYMSHGSYVFYSKGEKSDLNSVRCLQNTSEPPKAETPTVTESDSEGNREDTCPNREGPPITREVVYLESPEDHEGRDMAIFRLTNGENIWINGTPDSVKKGDRGSITYYEEQLPFDTDCWELNRLKSWKKTGESANTLTDTRDKQTYWTAKIGKQVWMAENLNYEAAGSKCYSDDPDNCKKYGRLYHWETAMKVCPKGWHLPSDAEWKTLTNFVGGSSTAGKKLKSKSGWEDNGNGTDEYGFSALPSGYCYFGFECPDVCEDGYPSDNVDNFHNVGYEGSWWSATENTLRGISYNSASISISSYDKDNNLYSVRCVQD